MKKTYIEPETVCVGLKVREKFLGASEYSDNPASEKGGGVSDALSRETVDTPDAWDEW